MKHVDKNYLDPIYLELDMHRSDRPEDVAFDELTRYYADYIRLTVLKHDLNVDMETESANKKVTSAHLQLLDYNLRYVSGIIVKYLGVCSSQNFELCVTITETYNNCMQKLGVILHQHRM